MAPLARVRLLAATLCAAALMGPLTAGAGAQAAGDDPFAPTGGGLPTVPLAAAAAAVPSGFQDTAVLTNLNVPMAVRFAADGRVFVAEKSGEIKVFDNLNDNSPTIYADLSRNVMDNWDRGLEGIALDPQFTTGRPFLYAIYTHDAVIGGTAPRWNDDCPTPPGPEADGCVVSGRLSKLSGGSEQVLIEDWCQQYPSHSVGTVAFGADGALYAGAGDGASFTFPDIGSDGNPVNPCGDPPGGVGGSMTSPTAEGGALRSQDLRTTGDPTGLDGTIIRVNPDTGAAMPDNPNAASSDPNTRRIIAHGLRNPFRFTFKPGSDEIYLGDVGWNDWEEIDRLQSPAAPVENFGWPCYEGTGRHPTYDNLNLNICENLYAAGASAVTNPLYTYNHAAKVSTESCPTGSSSISGIDFYDGGTFPSQYNGALFWADYSRNCIWVMYPGAGGTPDPATRQPFVTDVSGPVDLQVGPGGDLYYVALNSGEVRRIHAINSNHAPTADATSNIASGPVPLHVNFSASGSSDPDGDSLTYAWDLDGDGAYDDSTAVNPGFDYTASGTYTVRLRVRDPGGLEGTDTITITAGNPPTPTISTPAAGTTWKAGDVISFTGSATRDGGGAVPASGLSWTLVLEHCSALNPSSCHQHLLQNFSGASGSFTAPSHDYPSYLELKLTATDGGLSSTVTRRLDPKTVDLTYDTNPPGLQLNIGTEQQAAPFTRTAIQNSTVSLIAPSPQTLGGKTYEFSSWTDGGAAAHTITAPTTATTYRANFTEIVCSPPPNLAGAWGFDETSGPSASDSSGLANAGTITGATRTTAGKFGSALTFDGIDDLVTVPDANSLDLTNRATLEAWVYPTALGGSWRTALLKEQAGQLVYALYANDDFGHPTGHLFTSGDLRANGPSTLPLNTWSHLALTWDGTTARLFVNGTQVGTSAVGGTLVNGAGPLRFGGNGVWSEWFAGRLDEIRVYGRALTQAELQSDMATPVTCSGSTPTQPALAVSPTSLSFSGTQGGASPAAQSVAVSNTGGGTLNWTASDDASWMSVSPASGTGAGNVSVSVNTSGLAAGTYTGTVTVTATGASGSPKTIPVTLTVNPAPPALAVSPSTLSFSGTQGAANPAAQSVGVTNTGGGTLGYTVSDDQTWLNVTPVSGTAPGTLSVSTNTSGLAAGTYTGTVTVTAAGATGSPKTVAVTLTVNPASPVLAVSPSTLSFTATAGGANPAAQSISVSNTGGGTLNWTASDDASWMSVSPASGTGASNVSASVNTAGLAAGTYTGTVTVTATGASGSPKTVAVTLTVNPASPVLAVSPSTLSFTATAGGANPAAQSISVSNTGGGTLNWTASDDASWMSVSPASGTGASNVSASVNTAGLAAGTYTGTVTVTATGASGSPKTVAVTLTVNPASPVLAVSPSTLSFTATAGGANPAAQSISVSNTGGGTLNWTASDNQTWLTVAPLSGTGAGTVSASVNTAGLAAGTYTGTVTVTATGASGSPKTVAVTLTVNPSTPPPTGAVGAWGFDETSGGVNDTSGRGNNGTITGATRTTAGKYGSALTFDGVNDWVTVPDAASLDLTNRATLEAWVYPTALGTTWRTALLKEQPGQLVYALYANNDLVRPSGHLYTTGDLFTNGTAALPLNTWSHLAMTWDGTTQRLWLNGNQVGSRAVTGTLPNSTGVLRFGGNNVWSEWFAGRLDEIRIYDRALTQAELQADMARPIAGSG